MIETRVWLNVPETAAMLDLHPNTVKRLPPAELPYWTFNKRGDRKYDKADVEAFIEKRWVR